MASTLDSVLPKLVPLCLVLLLYFLFAKHNFTPIKGIILLVVLLNALLGVIQENRAEKSLEALKKLSSPRAPGDCRTGDLLGAGEA